MRFPRTALVLALASLLALSACGQRATTPNRAFEGKITEVIHLPGIGKLLSNQLDSAGGGKENPLGSMVGAAANVSLTMYVRENKVAYDMSMLGGLVKVHSIIDRTTRTITMLLPNHTAMVTNLKSFDSVRGKLDDTINKHRGFMDSLMSAIPQPTGKKMTINGLECEEYHVKTESGLDMDLWLTNDPRMKFYEVVRDAIMGRGRTGNGGLEEVFAMLSPLSSGKVPVKFETKYKGNIMIDGELKTIEEGPVNDKMFEVPKDYKVVSGDSIRMGHRNLKSDSDDSDDVEKD